MYRSCKGIVGSWGNKCFQEEYGTIVFDIFYGKLDVGVYRVDVLEELVDMFSLLEITTSHQRYHPHT